jgi:hypothetical protein
MPDQVEQLRARLQQRVSRLESTGFELFHFRVQQVWAFFRDEPFFRGLLDLVEIRAERLKPEVEAFLSTAGRTDGAICYSTEEDELLASYLVLKACAESDDQRIEATLGRQYAHDSHFDVMNAAFRSVFVEPLCSYLYEAIDERGVLLAALRRYKHRCEWFRRDALYTIWQADTQRGEKRLALDLYEYLFDEGIAFHMEPSSVSGEADLVSSQIGEERLILDAKIFNPTKARGKTYLRNAFNQIYTYTLDYNEPFGVLAIFNTSDQPLHLALTGCVGATPFLSHNHKSIFFLVIDIYPHEVSASKRGSLQSVAVSTEDLVTALVNSFASKHEP